MANPSTAMEDLTLPVQQIDLKLFQQILGQLDVSLKTRDYNRINNDATAAITQLIESQLYVLSDIRAYARAMQGYYNGAYEDAIQMIDCAPELGAGYVRLGNVYSISGRQLEAIEAYDEGLEKEKSDQTQIERLRAGKAAAIAKNETRIDYLKELPIELANNIIQKLSEGDMSICLSVSSVWRKRILDCSFAWTHMVITGGQKDLRLVSVMSSAGRYVESLDINTNNGRLHALCLEAMIDKRFDKIRTLKMKAIQDWKWYTGRISIAFWQIRDTLTTLSVDLAENKHAITLADILLPCCNLTDLSFTTALPMAKLTGDFSTMKSHNALLNLELTGNLIDKESIDGVLQRCPQLRRLVMSGCISSVVDSIAQYGSNLEILGYNSTKPIPRLEIVTTGETPGLRKMFMDAPVPRTRIRIESILPLVYKNRATLETVVLNTSSDLVAEDVQQLYAIYPEFKFEKLNTLTARLYRRIQPLILQSIRDTPTALAHLHALSVYDLQGLVDILMTMPPLITLQLASVETSTASASLVQLFEKYAIAAKSFGTPKLQQVIFRECAEITDSVLVSLAMIQSLNRVIFRALRNVTAEGIGRFLGNLPCQMKYVELCNMDSIKDSHIATLQKCPSLVNVALQGLQNVTDEGLRQMVYGKPMLPSGPNFYALFCLTVKACPLITEVGTHCVKEMVKTVVYEKYNTMMR
ncbi:hypothetical protein BJV82DRAFT_653443 [Fennellomyces sp. T-0311]|nr:hypothetical protein BJV82DRAFT_653443 [Fennellomyces sp. T-0311]